MRTHPLFKMLVMLTAWFYGSSLALAGQVVTDRERTWAKAAIARAKEEKALAKVGATNTLAVLYFRNKTGQKKLDALQKGLALMLITDLSKVDKIQVVERIKLQALLDEMELGTSGLVDQSTAPWVGRLLGAYYVADGEIRESPITDLEIQPYIIDVPFETVTSQSPASGSMDKFFRMEKKILFGIIEQMNILLSPAEKAILEKPISTSTAALMALFLGIDYSDQGKYENAAEMYQQALNQDPQLQLAKNALQELKTLGLVSGEATTTVRTTTVAEESGSGGTILAVGLGLAAIGGGVALALGNSSSDDDEAPVDNTSTGSSADTVAPTAYSDPKEATGISCYSGSVQFFFSETMRTEGTVTVNPSWTITSTTWSDDARSYTVTWKNSYDTCSGQATTYSVTFTLSGFADAAGNALAEPTEFSFTSSF